MPNAVSYTATIDGLRVVPVTVEVDMRPGLPSFRIIGLPDRSVAESRERVRSAMRNSGLKLPVQAITVSLTPATIPKRGSGIDLAIAIALMRAQALLPTGDEWILGELSLAGDIQGFAQIAAILSEAKRQNARCILPPMQDMQIPLALSYVQSSSLRQLYGAWQHGLDFQSAAQKELPTIQAPTSYMIDSLHGQVQAKRALQISLAGGHPLFLSGPPGQGKTMLASFAHQLLPSLSEQELEEVRVRYSLMAPNDKVTDSGIATRAPSNTSSHKQLIREYVLSHKGVLFLDEFPLFAKPVRESLRVPLESFQVQTGDMKHTEVIPIQSVVIAAQNSCPCGLTGSETGKCTCSQLERVRYAKAISAPLYERFDIFTELLAKDYVRADGGVSGQCMAEQIAQARARQHQRYGACMTNAEAQRRHIPIRLNPKLQTVLTEMLQGFNISPRLEKRLVSTALTIADLACQELAPEHLHEAVQYRQRPAIL